MFSVTKCNRAEIALSLLRENKNGFDIVISDVHMPDMDGFKLLEHVGLEMDLPVISKHLVLVIFDGAAYLFETLFALCFCKRSIVVFVQ